MRAAVLLSGLILVCGVAALFGVPAVFAGSHVVVGIRGLVVALAGAAVPPVVVFGWRKMSGK
jgi:hypothetical protein